MSLTKKVYLTISGYDIKLSDNLTFYQKDQLKLIFYINEYGIDYENNATTRALMPVNPLNAILFIENPEGVDSVSSAKIEDNAVTFYLDSTHTQYVGISRMQLRLFDQDGCAITLPHFTFEIRENIYGSGDVRFQNVVMVDQTGTVILTEDNDMLDVGDVLTMGTEVAYPQVTKTIKELPIKHGLDGTEKLIVEDNEATKQAPLGTIVDEIKQNSQEKIREIESELAQTNAQLSLKANLIEVVKRGGATLNDFDEETRSLILGLAENETNINAVLGLENVTTTNIKGGAITDDKIKGVSMKSIAEANCDSVFYNDFETYVLTNTLPEAWINTQGEIQQPFNLGYVSDYIPVKPSRETKLYSHSGNGDKLQSVGAMYDENKSLIGIIPTDMFYGGLVTFRTPSNCYYVRLNLIKSIMKDHYLYQKGKVSLDGLEVKVENIKSFSIENAIDLDITYSFSNQYYDRLNRTTVTHGLYVDDNGVINQFGDINAGGISDYIAVKEGMECQGAFYNVDGERLGYFGGMYDKNKNWVCPIPRGSSVFTTFTIPSGVEFIRINYDTNVLNEIYVNIPTIYYNFNNVISASSESYSEFSNIAFLGDSLTFGHGVDVKERYTSLVAKALKANELNYGISGTLVTQEDGKTGSFVERYTKIDENADLIVVFGTTNDYWNGSAPFGERLSVNPKEVNGALNNLIIGLQTNYPHAKLMFITPFNQYFNGVSSDTPNPRTGKSLEEYVNCILDRCRYHGVPVLDLFSESGMNIAHNEIHKNRFTQDGVHLSPIGNVEVSNKLIKFIKNNL